ncbi:hypothetical protein V6Z11_D08G173200 [Gossypium hirsutum]
MLLEFARKEQLHNHFNNWQTILLKIQAVLEDAEERQFTDRFVKIWLNDLKDLAYDIEDVLHDFSTAALRQKSKEESQTIIGKIRKYMYSFFDQFTFKYSLAAQIKEITTRMQTIAKQKDELDLIERSGGSRNRRQQRIPSTSLVNKSLVFGRESEKDFIINKLLFGEEESCEVGVPVIPIVGMGGLGKTTLAQLVYNDDRVKTFFKLRAWVYVSKEFDIVRVMKTLLESLNSTASDKNDLNGLQTEVTKMLSKNRFLIVLDDVWNENYNDWMALRSPFEAGSPESKIIVTTRNQQVASMMGIVSAYHLKEMSYDHCLSLFAQHALGSTNFDNHPNLKVVGEAIVKRCKGLPLAMKTLAGLLRCKMGYHEWEDIPNSKIWDLPKISCDILPALRLSYYYLPSHLKQCFAYCSLFPKGYEFQKDEVVHLWIAKGFIHQPKGMKKVEDLGSEYFHDLLSRSFFQQSSVSKSCYMMHDLINDLAQYVAGEVCFRLEDKVNSNGQYNVSERVRHSSFIRQKYDVFRKFEPFYKTKCLRTFLALPVFVPDLAVECYLTNKVFQDLLAKLGFLRMLSLTGYCISELPDCIGDLSHLRYLNLSRTKIRYLPESLCALCNLQTLDLRMGNLISLHYLNIVRTDNMTEMPLHIGKLINLKKLSKFIVAKGNGRRITELKGLSHLQWQLSLFDLQNVAEIRDVRVANLKEKRGLDDLIMKWSSASNDIRSEVDEFEVLDMLEPYQNLKKLSIFFYEGSKFPSWIGNPSFVNMVYLNICDCSNITSLPSLGRLPLLKDLHIERMCGVSLVDSEFYGATPYSDKLFPSLETLTFREMSKWEKWFQPLEFEAAEKVFPYLNQLVLQSCPKLLSIFECPLLTAPTLSLPSLRELNLEQCDERFLTRLKDLTALTRSLWQEGAGFENLSCLKRLAVIKCPQLLQLIDEDEELPSSLEYIEIEDCSNLVKLPKGMQKLRTLNDLHIKWCPKLLSFPSESLPSLLKNLVILECTSLQSLPKGVVHDGSSSITRCHLKQLEIVGCPSLLFPSGELPAALKRLEIWDCDWLDYIPERLLPNKLHVNQCSSLEYFPESGLPIYNLRALLIFECENLKSLPNRMYDLTTLQHLTVFGCPCIETFPEGGFPPKLLSFTILGCQQLKLCCAMWHLHKLTSLKDLIVGDFDRDMVSFPEDFTIPPNLLKSISEGLLDLISLEVLDVWNCPNLQCLPEKGLPITLGVLHIRNFPLLEEECRNEKGAYWPIISNLSRVRINYVDIR